MEPKIRFIGHKSNWSVVALDKVTTARNASNALVNNRNLLSLSYGKIVNKDIDSNKGLLPSSFSTYQIIEPDTIVFRGTDLQNDKRSLRVAISKQKGIISPAYVTMDVTDENILPDYLYLAMHWHDVAKKSYYKMGDGLRQTLPYSVLKELEIPFPNKSEQQGIIAYFQKFDAKLQASAKKVESLKKLKSASLVAMFPQQGKTTPKVRFKGFEGEWSTSNLGSIFAERIESNENGEMLSVTMNNGIIRSSDNGRFDNSNSDKSKYKVVKIGDIAYNSMRMWQGASGVSQYEGIVSPAYTVVTPRIDVNTDFFGYLFKTDDVIRLFKLNSQGLTSDNWNLKYPAFSRICVSYPESKEEQQAIAAYFRSLDRKIALETARLEKLKQIKLACLDKMFV